MPHRVIALVLAFTLGVDFCAGARAQTADFASAIERMLASGTHAWLTAPSFAPDREALREAYARTGGGPLWISGTELSRPAIAFLQALRAAGDRGLRPEDYDATRLVYHAVDLLSNRSADDGVRADFDMALSIAAARFVRHLHFGRVDPRAAGFNLNAPRAPFDVADAILKLAATEDIEATIEALEPQFLHYQLTKRALQRYRLLAIDAELTQLPRLPARSVKPGEAYEGAAALRRLLIAVGDLPPTASGSDTMLDDTLVEGLKQYQRRHGLAIDGALGRKTFATLTTPPSHRALQLALALERWRWLPEFTAPPIVVNIPQFRLFAFHGLADRAADMLQMDVIVGQTYPTTQTPTFMADMKYVVFRPYWDVPYSITVKEMLPAVRKQANYFAANNIEIVRGADEVIASSPTGELLQQLTDGALRLRQRPGDDNALGLIKFMLPNAHNVYLHSTPARQLFDEPRRAFSHGCIRVSDPISLAEHVLKNAAEPWSREAIVAAMNDESTNNRHVFLERPIPVLIVYGTAIVLENGEVQFFDDLYGHDAKLLAMLRRT